MKINPRVLIFMGSLNVVLAWVKCLLVFLLLRPKSINLVVETHVKARGSENFKYESL
jgi:hypothetical protein